MLKKFSTLVVWRRNLTLSVTFSAFGEIETDYVPEVPVVNSLLIRDQRRVKCVTKGGRFKLGFCMTCECQFICDLIELSFLL